MKPVTQNTTLATLEVADPTKNLILVPLSQLRPSRRNVRKTNPKLSIPELASSIQRVGLLQNLIVSEPEEGDYYEVEAGGRRLAALKLLAKKKRIAADHEVPCLLVADASARTVSLTENVQREAMHAADQFEAFAALVKEGRPIEDIAADFSVTPLVVQRRLKLANVSPRLLTDYRSDRTDAVTLEQLMVLAITDDHEAQEAAFFGAPEWQRSPSALRERLTAREIDAYQHPLVRFVGLAAYEAAGGGTRRDLFAEGESGVYLTDSALLDRLAQEKLEGIAEEVRAEGWTWVEAAPTATYADLQAFQRAPQERRQPNAREAKRIAKLNAKAQSVETALQAAIDAEDEDKVDALHDKGERLSEQLSDLDTHLMTYSPTVRAAAGAVVTIDRHGEAVIHRGLLREAEAKALRMLARAQAGGEDEKAENTDRPESDKASLSEKLARRLSAHRTAALQIELARHPQAALAALVQSMVQTVLQDSPAHELPIGVQAQTQDRLEAYAPDYPQSPAAVALRELRQAWLERLPPDDAELFAWLLALPQEELVRLLALCVASTVDVVASRAREDRGAVLAQTVGLDMRAWWTASAEGYFRHVPKAVILEAARQFAPAHITRLSKLKKADLASEAERLAAGTGWMPAVFGAAQANGAELIDPVETIESETREDAEGDDEADALAA
jgi:ParB family transcriptional regulator, chromosome partitioning protein